MIHTINEVIYDYIKRLITTYKPTADKWWNLTTTTFAQVLCLRCFYSSFTGVILCYSILTIHTISEGNIALFTKLHHMQLLVTLKI